MIYDEFTVENNGTTLYCKRYLPSSNVNSAVLSGEKKPLILIHGGCIDSDFYDAAGPLLANLFDVVTFDRRGFGRSAHPETGDYSVATQVADAHAVLRAAFGDAPAFVFSHSAAGPIAAGYAIEHPEHVRQLLLFEPPILDCIDADSPLMAEIEQIKSDVDAGQKAGSGSGGFLFGLGPKDPLARKLTSQARQRSSDNIRTSVVCEADIFFSFKPNYDALKRLPVVVATAELNRGYALEGLAFALADKLECPLVRYPGAHNCPTDLPMEFACMTAGVFLMKGMKLL